GYDDQDNAVAAATVWSAGPGKPGLLEPVGVHADHRGHGYGTAISVAAAAALRELGASSALVSTPSSNTAAVATYKAAGYQPSSERLDAGRRSQLSSGVGGRSAVGGRRSAVGGRRSAVGGNEGDHVILEPFVEAELFAGHGRFVSGSGVLAAPGADVNGVGRGWVEL
ncbi:GNAT family N-acetyltransferase, partial [Streptomyces longisporoflavus]|uniref:GNAT family N-acetyltransferase n=1 Tax=Streptomyces longisporoflavus TaxID=28044 RepID=UPI001E4C114E